MTFFDDVAGGARHGRRPLRVHAHYVISSTVGGESGGKSAALHTGAGGWAFGAQRCCAPTGMAALRAYWAGTKWPRRFCCQQASVLWVQKGFSLPKLTVLMRSAEIPRETRYCLTAPARRSPRARLYSVEPRSSQWPSMVTRTPGLLRRNSAVLVSASRASARMSALLKSK